MTSSRRSSTRKPRTKPTSRKQAPGIESLNELALDLHWAWNHSADELWGRLEPDLWAATHNPWVVLQTVSKSKLQDLLGQSDFRDRVETLLDHRRRHLTEPAWFQQSQPETRLGSVAYFSMEFALSEALPIYSGGLGNVAGDQLKAACDLGVPVVGIGLLYQQGYFRQVIRPDGSQQALFPYNDPGQLPITPVRDSNGDWLRVEITLPGYPIHLRAWQVKVDRRTLYLLDSNDPANPPAARAITAELYGGGPELRLQQELVLGIGGWRLLSALGPQPEVCHLNEGHAAFAVLERARTFGKENGCPFEVALAATRAGNLFTTHTAVPAGFDRFAPALIAQYLRRYAEEELGIALDELLALGREDANEPDAPFNMAYLALRGSSAVNGVSRLHGDVSRRLFRTLFPRWPESEVPIRHVTNGIHVPTWDSRAADDLWTTRCGHDRWHGTMQDTGHDLTSATDADLWTLRSANRQALVEYVRERVPREIAATGGAPDVLERAHRALDPSALTLGFARRFATYKRPTLLLHSPERLIRILSDPVRPVQLVIAGKAHPADVAGQALLTEWVRFSRRPEVEGRVVFIPDYDLIVAEHLVQGVDVWINTPRRPWEASGTSGMKVLVNGGLNFSELDGWWAEAFDPGLGWAIGDGREHGDDSAWDAAEAGVLYDLLEREVVPTFYTRDGSGIPAGWVTRMRESMANLTPWFSANRVVREYTERYYVPSALAYRKRAANKGMLAKELVAWKRKLTDYWHEARFGSVRVETRDKEHQFAVEVHLGRMDPESLRVELFANAQDGGEPFRQPMVRGRQLADSGDGYEYTVSVSSARPAGDFTPRLVPYHPEARAPLEAGHILWQR